jgi:hypothetical protein
VRDRARHGGARHSGGRRPGAENEVVDWAADHIVGRAALDPRLADGHRPSGVCQADDPEPDVTERVTLIEFTWIGMRGAQPVIFVAREWLH